MQLAGLYRGMSSPIAGVAFVNAIVFGVYGNTQRKLSEPDALHTHFLAGAIAGIAQSPVCSSMELAKTRLQLQSSSGERFSGPVECLRYIYRGEGLRGIFKGLGITFLREAPGYGTYFLTYEALTRSNSSTPISTFQMLMAGGLAGTSSWVVTYPIDVIKSRLQADITGRYSGAVDCLRQSISAEGYACLFRGLNSTIIRAFPTNAATFTVVTWSLRLLNDAPSEAPQTQTNPVTVHKESPRATKLETGFLTTWQTTVANLWTNVHQSRSYSMISAVGFESNSSSSSVLSLTHDRTETKKVFTEEPEAKILNKNSLRSDSDVEDEDEQNDLMLEKKNESHESSNANHVPKVVLVVDKLSAPFGELKENH